MQHVKPSRMVGHRHQPEALEGQTGFGWVAEGLVVLMKPGNAGGGMPGMDGLTLLTELRRREVRARCILISAFLNDGVRQQAELLGVDRILDKPVDVALLRAAVSELLPAAGNLPAGMAV